MLCRIDDARIGMAGRMRRGPIGLDLRFVETDVRFFAALKGNSFSVPASRTGLMIGSVGLRTTSVRFSPCGRAGRWPTVCRRRGGTVAFSSLDIAKFGSEIPVVSQ